MTDFISMTCKSCGGKLQITPDIDDFACMYCGTEFKVKREGGIVALSPLVEEMKKVSVSSDKTAAELALMRLNNEIKQNRGNLRSDYEITRWKEQKETEIKILRAHNQNRLQGTLLASFLVILILVSALLNSLFHLTGPSVLITSSIIAIIVCVFIYIRNPLNFLQRNDIEKAEALFTYQLSENLETQKKIEQLIEENQREIERNMKIVDGGDI